VIMGRKFESWGITFGTMDRGMVCEIYEKLRSLVDGCFVPPRSLIMNFPLMALRLYLLVIIVLSRCAFQEGAM